MRELSEMTQGHQTQGYFEPRFYLNTPQPPRHRQLQNPRTKPMKRTKGDDVNPPPPGFPHSFQMIGFPPVPDQHYQIQDLRKPGGREPSWRLRNDGNSRERPVSPALFLEVSSSQPHHVETHRSLYSAPLLTTLKVSGCPLS